MHSIELAWAAGFFDGEGTTGTECYVPGLGRGAPRLRLALSAPQVDPRPLQRLSAALGVGSLSLRPARGNARPIWRWRCNGGAAERALSALWPYLSEPKREQAMRAVERITLDRTQRRHRAWGGLRPLARLRAMARAQAQALGPWPPA